MIDLRALRKFFTGPDLEGRAKHTYRRHFAHIVFLAMGEAILANAPIMALKGMESPDWQMALEKSISSIGMFLLIYLGSVMAVRRKMPFLFFPGIAYALCALAMAFIDDPLPFLILLGLGTLFDNILRPALTAIVRLNYPVETRGAVVGELRKWSSILFLGTGLLSAALLDFATESQRVMIRGQMVAAGLLLIMGFAVFRTIRVREDAPEREARPRVRFADSLKASVHIVKTDRRFRRYLAIGFFYCFGGMTFASFIPVLLTKDLRLSYVETTLLTHVFPAMVTFFTTGYIGQWIDRVSTWKAWFWIRLGWGLDAVVLAAAPFAAALFPLAALVLPFAARLFRGVVQGGSYILWWEVAVNHFAPPGEDTTRYMGIIMFLNGLGRLGGPLFGAFLVTRFNAAVVLLAGGGIVLFSSFLSYLEHRRERDVARLRTMETYENSFE